MTLEEKLARALEASATAIITSKPSWQQVSPFIDLTLLDNQARDEDLKALVTKALHYQVAAICVLPSHLKAIPPIANIKRATVANFPTGNQAHRDVIKAVDNILEHEQIDELDYVFPYQHYLEGKQAQALSNAADVYQRCQQQAVRFKVILETGALPSLAMIYQLSRDVLNTGCDFLKTSTGKISEGANLPAVFTMLTAIIESNVSCGIKCSGGIRTIEQARAYMQLAEHVRGEKLDKKWFRLGMSKVG